MNIIIPIGGIGERFNKEGYFYPKPLINFLGKPLIFWLIDNLNLKDNAEIHIPYNHRLDKFNFCDTIRKQYPKLNIHFYRIDFLTRGASETVLVALNNFTQEQLHKKTVILDSDNIYLDDVLTEFNKMDDSCIFYFEDYGEKPIYSYIIMNSYGLVASVEEKVKISHNANCGVFGFSSGILLKTSIEDIINRNLKSNNEFYVSNIYKYILETGKDHIRGIKIKNFVSLGTPESLKIATYNFRKLQQKKRFCFDLDNTLVTYPIESGDYTTVMPIQKNINLANFLHSLGHEIIIHTARRMKTHHGNNGRVLADIGRITLDTLEKFQIKYNEIYFGKPYADFYIDDCAINAFDDIQKQIGFYDLNIEPRDSNTITYKESSVIKSSEHLAGLKSYYSNIPKSVEHYYPKLLNSGAEFIEMELIQGLTLSQLYVNNCFMKFYLDRIFEYFDDIHKIKPTTAVDIYGNYHDKTKKRLEVYQPNFRHIEYFETYSDTLNFLKAYEVEKRGEVGMVHGDPVFTNIILSETGTLKFIDMRGKVGDELTVFGDIFYDYAKVYQSLLGYDEILHGKKINSSYKEDLVEYFEKKFVAKFGPEKMKDLKEITKSLLLTLLPIHNNEKCIEYFRLLKRI